MPNGLRIGLIDSGINAGHPHVGAVAGGASFGLNAQGKVSIGSAYADEIGHGTALAGIIACREPRASIYALKIFNRQLSTNTKVLLAAIQWALDQQCRLVHLSLGTRLKKHLAELKSLCSRASAMGVAMVASCPSRHEKVYPAALKEVIGVYWSRSCAWDDLEYHPNQAIEFGAHGHPRQLPGLPREMNFKGSSFAAAHITGMAANVMAERPALKPNQLSDYIYRRLNKSTFNI